MDGAENIDILEGEPLEIEADEEMVEKVFINLNNDPDLAKACRKVGIHSNAFLAAIFQDKNNDGRIFNLLNILGARMVLDALALAMRVDEGASSVPAGLKFKYKAYMELAALLAPDYFSNLAKKAKQKKMLDNVKKVTDVEERPLRARLDIEGAEVPRDIETTSGD